MLKIILIVVALLVIAFLIIVAIQPATFRVTRSAVISAPPSVVFEQVNDFHKWDAWSPWAKLDPNMKQTYEGPAAGTGAVYSWAGNKEVGEGRMTMTESRANEMVRIKLEFLKPFKATSTTEFTVKPQSEQTAVEWAMFGENNFMSKAFHLFMNIDKMVGKDFEKGLAQMKSAAEAAKIVTSK